MSLTPADTTTADAAATAADSRPPLLRAAEDTSTALWNDSADPKELAQSIAFGAVGATCNPVIALTAIQNNPDIWLPRLRELAAEYPTATEDWLGWKAVEELSIQAAQLLEPIFHEQNGRNGRLSIQTDPRFHRSAEKLIEQTMYFDSLAPNIIVKIPAVAAGIEAIEEVTYRGVSINATVSFTVPQALAVGAAVERGLQRREAEGLDISTMGPVCTIMGGRLDDWIKFVAARDGIVLTEPGYFEWAGVAALKKGYEVFTERGYRTRILSAAFRNTLQWSELVGGDLVVSPPFAWQKLINGNPLTGESRIDIPVEQHIIDELYERIPDFRRAYDEDGLTVDEFASFGATARTLRQFLAANNTLEALVRNVVVPDPDTK